MDKEIKRLSKVAKELSVGISTVVEFLHKKGITIDPNPNTKVSAEWYNLLAKEFSSDIKAKKDSEQLSLRKAKEKKESISIDNTPVKEREDIVENDDFLRITDNTSKKTTEKIEPKIVGKIDLNTLNTKHKTEEEHKILESPISEEEKTELVDETTKKHQPVDEVFEEEDDIEETDEEDDAEYEDDEVIEETESDLDEFVDDDTSEDEIIEEVFAQDEEDAEIEDEIDETEEDVQVDEVVGKKDNELKVIGRIDLDALNQRTRPPKKTRKQRDDERKEKEKVKRDAIDKVRKDNELKRIANENLQTKENIGTNETKKDINFIQTDIKKLTGPTILGKINLPDENKQNQQSGDQDKKFKRKKKRKRINKDMVDVKEQGANTTQNPDDKKVVDKTKQKQLLKKTKKTIPLRTDITDEDVQKQIKETLARLTIKGKSKGAKHRRDKREELSRKLQEEFEKQELEKKILKVTEFVSANELANLMNVPVNQIIATCLDMGAPASINQRLDADTITLVASEYGYEVQFIGVDLQNEMQVEEEKDDNIDNLVPRAPIVTVMGHVDHGKTSLLDYVRKTNVIAGEAGGITQHIGAYNVQLKDGRKITFLDTPGHEAFTAMRARGAKITDIAIIVVSADDSVMPQTIEAINHAQAANVPIVFAINKIDKPGANPEKIKEQLAKMNLLVEDWGGSYQSHDISAKKGVGVDDLLEKVLLQAEMLDLKANPKKRAVGSIIEAALDKGRGFITKLLVQNGSMKIGDLLLSGEFYGRVKAMYNERNNKVTVAGPSEAVLVLGLNGAPQAGEKFNVMESEREAKEIATKRSQINREIGIRTQKHVTLDEIGRRIAVGNFRELNIIIKGDVMGSLEALGDSLIKLSTEQIQVNVIHKAVGQISENDVLLATASNAIIVGFMVRPSGGAKKLAEKEGIDIRFYTIIYDAINEIKDAMNGMLAPEVKEEVTGYAEIMEIFKITKVGNIAGCMVRDGKIVRTGKVRVIRDGIVVYTGELGSLKRFKDDAKEVFKGNDCGLNINKFNDIKVGDIVECFIETMVKPTL